MNSKHINTMKLTVTIFLLLVLLLSSCDVNESTKNDEIDGSYLGSPMDSVFRENPSDSFVKYHQWSMGVYKLKGGVYTYGTVGHITTLEELKAVEVPIQSTCDYEINNGSSVKFKNCFNFITNESEESWNTSYDLNIMDTDHFQMIDTNNVVDFYKVPFNVDFVPHSNP